MAAWITYLKERFPLPVYVLLVGGFSTSGLLLDSGSWDTRAFVVSFIGLLLFFGLLRLMDEYKDYEKDIVAHPDRPLPRGLLSVDQVKSTINKFALLMVAYSVLTAAVTTIEAGAAYFFITVYLWLMYREFYLGEWLGNRPILYAVSHQAIILAVCVMAVTVSRPEWLLHPMTWSLGMAILGSFFSYEICRKLDPNAHPVLKTYLYMYGPKGTSLLVLATSSVAAVGAYGLGIGHILWPIQALLVLSLVVLFVDIKKFKIVELVATLSLLVHLWAVVVIGILEKNE